MISDNFKKLKNDLMKEADEKGTPLIISYFDPDIIQTQLTKTAEFNIESKFSPDGTKIIFISNRDDNSEIYIMNRDGSNQKRLTNTSTRE